jgi:hypothetical protein
VLVHTIEAENTRLPDAARQYLAGEMRLIAVIQSLVVREMVDRLARS